MHLASDLSAPFFDLERKGEILQLSEKVESKRV